MEQKYLASQFIVLIMKELNNQKCIICEQHSRSKMVCLANCLHIFCSPCLHRHCIYKIDVMEDVTCPQQGFQAVLQTNNQVYEQLPSERKKRYSRYFLWKQTINNPTLKLCPNQNCQQIIDKSKEVYQCNKCQQKYCKNCQLVEHIGACDQNFLSKFKDWKRCPKCQILIVRDEGCNHIICRCSQQFCYVCLAAWQTQHYDCGPKNLRARIAEATFLQRIFLGMLFIVGLPIYVSVYVRLWALSIAVATLIGFLGGPFIVYDKLPCAHNSICLLFCPVFMGIGAMLGGVGAIFGGFYFLLVGCKSLILLLKLLWCECQKRPKQAQFDGQLLEN